MVKYYGRRVLHGLEIVLSRSYGGRELVEGGVGVGGLKHFKCKRVFGMY